MLVPSIYLQNILADATRRQASSLHFSVGSLPMARIAGQLEPIDKENHVTLDFLNAVIGSFIDEGEVEALKSKKELVLIKDFAGSIRCRVDIYYQRKLPTVAFFPIPARVLSLEALELPPVYREALSWRSGLFVVAGSVRSGKTTSAMSLLEEANTSSGKLIVTIEDPVEYAIVGQRSIVNQRQVGRDVSTLADGLVYALNEDADLIYVGRNNSDLARVMPAVCDLSAGCVVIFEMVADSAVMVVEKLVNALARSMSLEAARYSVADSLSAVSVQRLLPRRGGGLVPVFEVLKSNPAMRGNIREGKSGQLQALIETSLREGMITFDKSIAERRDHGELAV